MGHLSRVPDQKMSWDGQLVSDLSDPLSPLESPTSLFRRDEGFPGVYPGSTDPGRTGHRRVFPSCKERVDDLDATVVVEGLAGPPPPGC